MGREIERKFLVSGEFRHLDTKKLSIMQAYLCIDPVRTIRIRMTDGKARLTIKGAPEKGHLGRMEWEVEIPPKMADDLLEVCLPGRISKTRYLSRQVVTSLK